MAMESEVQPKVHIVLLNWNSFGETSVCLTSLKDLRYDNRVVIVVDNGSTDDSVARIKAEFPWVEVILAGKNLGFPCGCNIGMRRALEDGADYVWLLNNDATADPGALEAIVAKAESDPRLGAIGSAIYEMEEPSKLQAWGGGYVNFWMGHARHYLAPIPDQKVDYITGASFLIPRAAMESVGLLDEGIFLYWDDPEYCWRLKRAGWKIGVAGDSKIWHKGMTAYGKKSPRMDTFFNASAARFFREYSPIPMISVWVGVTLRMGKRLLMGDFDRARAVWAGATQKNSVPAPGRVMSMNSNRPTIKSDPQVEPKIESENHFERSAGGRR